jgi:hypothetical protein
LEGHDLGIDENSVFALYKGRGEEFVDAGTYHELQGRRHNMTPTMLARWLANGRRDGETQPREICAYVLEA